MPKNIVLLSDGTTNDVNSCTNVYILAQLLKQNEDQVVFYHTGIGTTGSEAERAIATMFAGEMPDKVMNLYKDLIKTYEPGDCIFLFGFSRGAATIRALSCMVENVGIIDVTKNKPKDIDALICRAYNLFIKDKGVRRDDTINRFVNNYCIKEKTTNIYFIGCFDTVSALGVPNLEYDDVVFFKYVDRDITKNVKYARHAMAIDENRKVFNVETWDCTEVNSVQCWFAGGHSDIGGGWTDPVMARGLPNISLRWMIDEVLTLSEADPKLIFKENELRLIQSSKEIRSGPEPVITEVVENTATNPSDIAIRSTNGYYSINVTPHWLGKAHQGEDTSSLGIAHRKIGRYEDERVHESAIFRVGKVNYQPNQINDINHLKVFSKRQRVN